jgi:hypothetical protein
LYPFLIAARIFLAVSSSKFSSRAIFAAGGQVMFFIFFVSGGLVDFPLCSNLHQLSRRVNYYFLFFSFQI